MRIANIAALSGVMLGWIITVAPCVLAHSFPETENPGAGQTMAASPSEVVVKFDAAIEKLFAKLEVLNPQGKSESVSQPEVSSDGRSLSVKIATLEPGEYQVRWAVTCVDTHHTQGSYSFTVASKSK